MTKEFAKARFYTELLGTARRMLDEAEWILWELRNVQRDDPQNTPRERVEGHKSPHGTGACTEVACSEVACVEEASTPERR